MGKPLVMVTGASSGIGEAVARLFASRGYPLLLCARRKARLLSLNLPSCHCTEVDVTDREAVVRAVAEGERMFGPVDLLVNNAGIMLLGKASSQAPTEWDTMIDTNIKGALNCIHAVAGAMKARRGGTIINIGSVAGRKTFVGGCVYNGTKFALHAMSEALREELAPSNVRVCVIAPGAVDTELAQHITDPAIREASEARRAAMGGGLSATDVAETVRFVYELPQSVCLREIVLSMTCQER